MALPPEQRQRRARIAIASRWHPDDPGLAEQRREFRVAQAEQYIRELLGGSPPPTGEQRAQLALLLKEDGA